MVSRFVRIAQMGHDTDAVARIGEYEYTHDELRRALNEHSETFASSSPSAMFQPGLPYGHRPTDEHKTTLNMVKYLVNEIDDGEIHERLKEVRSQRT